MAKDGEQKVIIISAEGGKTGAELGFTMITLDCSEHIKNDITLDNAPPLPKYYAEKYLNKKFEIENGITLAFNDGELRQCAAIYSDAIQFAAEIPAVSTVNDKDLPKLFENNDARQLIHITYGLILSRKNLTVLSPSGTASINFGGIMKKNTGALW